MHVHGELFAGGLGGRRVAANHYPQLAAGLAASGDFDLVFFGHDHRFAIDGGGER